MKRRPALSLVCSAVIVLLGACGGSSEDSATNNHGGSGGSTDAGWDATGGTGGATCAPMTCESVGAECGAVSDGCGKTLTCGGCDTGEVCGGGGPNLCGTNPCTPKTCGQLGAACGQISDGCGSVLDCGTCPAGLVCGNAQVSFQCVPIGGGTGGSGGTSGTGGTGGSGGPCTSGESCDDGNACTQNDMCNASSQCVGGAAVSCTSPPNGCFVSSGVCDSLSGSCSYPYQASGIPCEDDSNPCTIDQCDGAGQCSHTPKADGTSCGSGSCSGGVCVASCQGGGTVSWSQSQAAWYGNPGTAGTYSCSASVPVGSFVQGATVQLVPNEPQKREGSATATCSSGTWQVSGPCNGKIVDTALNSECTASSPATRQMIAGWYIADLYRCADSAGLDYWVGVYESPSPTVCTPASNYDGYGSKQTCWRAVFRNTANDYQGCYDQAQSYDHLCDSDAATVCPPGAFYPWSSIASVGETCKYGP